MFHIIHFDQIDSTNTYAKNHLNKLHHYDVIHADHQTLGRGRRDHTWHSSPKENLMATLIIKEAISPEKIQQLTQVIALSIVEVCQSINIEAKIKFPNDIYIHDKKVAGILIETQFTHQLDGIIIGFGINVKESHLLPTATSLYQHGCQLSIEAILHRVLYQFDKNYQLFKQGNYMDLLKQVNDLSYLKNKKVHLDDQDVSIGSLLEDGRIEIIHPNKIEYRFINEFTLSKHE